MNPPRKQTYSQILKSSAIIGSSSLATIVLAAVRTKAMALMLGPSGVGLLGVYQSILELAKGVANMGTSVSAVRQIGEANGSSDQEALARTVQAFRRLLICLGALGALLMVCFSKPISKFSFGDDQHTVAVAVLGLGVFLTAVTAGQTALVQGVRRMADLARMSIFGALGGLLISIPTVFFYRERGIVPSILAASAIGVVVSWWYSRKVRVERVVLPLRQFLKESAQILKLGLVFLSIMLMSLGVAYLARIIVVNNLGVPAAGYYQAAWAVGALYVMTILQMMGADFLPRLSAVASSSAECTRLVNEQVEVNMLMGGPGILATLSLSPVVIILFYSTRFGPATEVLRWICLGMALRIASWPMGYMLIAKNSRSLVFWSELLNRSVELGLVWLCVRLFGLVGAGIGFFISCVFYLFLIHSIVRFKYGFCWSANNRRIGLIYGSLILTGFGGWYVLPHSTVIICGTVVTVVAAFCSLKAICALLPFDRLPKLVQEVLALFRLVPAPSASLEPS